MSFECEDGSKDNKKHIDTAMSFFPFFEIRICAEVLVVENDKYYIRNDEKT